MDRACRAGQIINLVNFYIKREGDVMEVSEQEYIDLIDKLKDEITYARENAERVTALAPPSAYGSKKRQNASEDVMRAPMRG